MNFVVVSYLWLPEVMWQVERDASFDVITEAEVAKGRQGNIEDNDDAHGDI